MCTRHLLPRAAAIAAIAACLWGCGEGGEPALPPDEAWVVAQERWDTRAIDAWDAWMAIDPRSREGRRARERLARADAHYREGVRRLETGEADAAASMRRGVRVAPMDPAHYLSLARACASQGLTERSKEYYRKYLAARPRAPEAAQARAELGAMPRDVFDPPIPTVPVEVEPEREALSLGVPAAAAGGAAFTLALLLLVVALRNRGVSLERLARDNPELHPAIAYLVGSLRHELLKHRVGAVGDAVAALERGDASREQLSFLNLRLYGGEPLPSAWDAHLRAFERALGYRLDLRRDRAFRRAGRVIRRIHALERSVARGDAEVARTLASAHAELRRFDAGLSRLVAHLVRTVIDEALLREIVEEVRAEYAPGLVELDALEVAGPAERVEVEVFRVDFVLVLKNIVRNAVLAVGRAPPPRRVGVEVALQLLPTGEEIVRVRVLDTSDESLSTQAIYDRRVDRGLGLVTAALSRYDGAIEVEPAGEGWAKAVSIRFFRALDEGQVA